MATAVETPTGQLWVRALRAPFLVASLTPFGVGASLAFLHLGTLDAFLLLVTFVAVAALHLATNMFNDNFDFRSGNDLAVRHQNPFAGGGRVLITGRVSPRAHLAVATAFFLVGTAAGLYLIRERGLVLLALGLLGALSVYGYVGPPFRWAHRGVGELLVGLNFGPVLVVGTYYVQVAELDLGVVLASLPLGLLVGAILWVNEFPDVEADTSVGKRTLMARLGLRASVGVYQGLLASAYVLVAIPALLAWLPLETLLVFLSLPVAWKAARHLRAHPDDPHAMIPANALTILLLLVFGALYAGGFWLAILF